MVTAENMEIVIGTVDLAPNQLQRDDWYILVNNNGATDVEV